MIRLDHLNLTVHDLDETTAWYERVFGFTLAEEGVWEGVRWAILRSGDTMLCAYHRPEFHFMENDGLRNRPLHGIRHAGFRITDESRWRETIERERLEVEEIVYPHSRSWYVHDPTGYEIEVVCWNDDRVAFEPAAKEEIR